MRQYWQLPMAALLIVSVSTIVTTGCGSSTAKARIMNAAPGEGAITATIGDTTVVTSLAYGIASSYTTVSSGGVQLNVEQSSSATSVIDKSISLTSNSYYTVLLANYSTAVAAVTLTDDNSSPSSGDFNLRIVQASPSLGAADVYVVAPGTSLSSVNPSVSNLSFESASSYLPETAGTYEIYFTPAGQKEASIDSGPIAFKSGQVRTLVGLNGSAGGYTTALLSDLN